MFGGLGNVLFALVVVLSGRSVAGNYDDLDYVSDYPVDPDYPDYPNECSPYMANKKYWEHTDIGSREYYGSQLQAQNECDKYDACIAIACENANPGHCYLVKEKAENYGAAPNHHDKWTWFDKECKDDGLQDDFIQITIGKWKLCVNLDAEGGCKSDNTINPPVIGGPTTRTTTRTPSTVRPPGNTYDPAKCCKSNGVPTMCLGICDCVDSTPSNLQNDFQIHWGKCGQYKPKIETCQKKCKTTTTTTTTTTTSATQKCKRNEPKKASKKKCEKANRVWKCKEVTGQCRSVCCHPKVADDLVDFDVDGSYVDDSYVDGLTDDVVETTDDNYYY